MTDDELNTLADDTGIYWVSDYTAYMHPDTMRKFADAITAKERERCAELCDNAGIDYDCDGMYATLIRESN